jgi:hypothetical protein
MPIRKPSRDNIPFQSLVDFLYLHPANFFFDSRRGYLYFLDRLQMLFIHTVETIKRDCLFRLLWKENYIAGQGLSLPFLFVFLLSVWQVEALPIFLYRSQFQQQQ